LNEFDSVEKMVSNINETIGLDDYEIIIVNSGGTETSVIRKLPMVHIYDTPREGAPQARNFGANKASKDALLFADAHLQFRHGWGPKILNDLKVNEDSVITPCITVMDDENRRACGFKWINLDMEILWLPDLNSHVHEIPFACSCCMAVKKCMFDEIGQFDSGIRFWGEEDSEISMRAWLMGHRVLCDPYIRVGHMFRNSHPYDITWFDRTYNKIRLSLSHFSIERIQRHLTAISYTPDFDKILLKVVEDRVLDRRDILFDKRIYDDDWFFETFPMDSWGTE
jgi:glycosyltransferase involved in cell wall biosynthesis